MSYTLTELLHNFRRDQDDEVEPYLWSDEEFFEFLEEAQDEFCELVDVLAANITVPYVAADVVANNGYIDISQYRITKVRNASLETGRKYLTLANQEEIDESPYRFMETDYGLETSSTSWQYDTGEPRVLITDYQALSWRLYPLPITDDTINARVFYKPLESPINGDNELVITDKSYQRAIMYKVRSLAYMKQDPETYDKFQSAELNAQFMSRVNDFDKRVKRARRRMVGTGYGGIPQS